MLSGKLQLPYPLEGGKTKDCAVCSDRQPGGERKQSKFYSKNLSKLVYVLKSTIR